MPSFFKISSADREEKLNIFQPIKSLGRLALLTNPPDTTLTQAGSMTFEYLLIVKFGQYMFSGFR